MKNEKIEKLIGEIKDGTIKPLSQWHSHLKRIAPWILIAAIVIVGGVALAVMISPIDFFDGRVLRTLGAARTARVITGTLMNLWIILIVLLSVLGVFVFKKTEKGYRHQGSFIAGVLVAVIIGIGLFAHAIRLHESVEWFMEHRAPVFLLPHAPSRGMRLSNPKGGMLVGAISELAEGSFSLKDPQQRIWKIYYTGTTTLETDFELMADISVIIVGEVSGENEFEAKFIRPFNFDLPMRHMR